MSMCIVRCQPSRGHLRILHVAKPLIFWSICKFPNYHLYPPPSWNIWISEYLISVYLTTNQMRSSKLYPQPGGFCALPQLLRASWHNNINSTPCSPFFPIPQQQLQFSTLVTKSNFKMRTFISLTLVAITAAVTQALTAGGPCPSAGGSYCAST